MRDCRRNHRRSLEVSALLFVLVGLGLPLLAASAPARAPSTLETPPIPKTTKAPAPARSQVTPTAEQDLEKLAGPCSAQTTCSDGSVISCTGSFQCSQGSDWVECDGNRIFCPARFCAVFPVPFFGASCTTAASCQGQRVGTSCGLGLTCQLVCPGIFTPCCACL